MSAPDPRRVSAASKRFQTFFDELKQAFVEREDLLVQIALALLAREHVLMTGPPGTAKSQIASGVLRRIVDEQTGLPSLYARQFTESTVQTDLVGPIDFKTLMDTGRTEHFTDQGILGAVHAFLDEVFDGRDMLLRSALNVLHERELKEGTKVTRGAIECAIMTSNRYLAEILEGSRDTLLAFVDRIAFVAFMPRGFADPRNLATVLRRHVGGAGGAALVQPLTVQDLDALQATVDSVHVSDAACDAIATFLERLELEISAAAKADPTFVPTRYVSTRTAVRCGRVLRAIVVFDRIFLQPGRPLEVLPEDFGWLRLHLLLSGPSREGIDKLLARETDPRERRQLSIVRTERDAFERSLAKVPRFAPSARVPPPEVAALERAASDALGSADPARLVSSVQALTPLALAGGPTADRAAALVKQMAETLAARAVRVGLTSTREPEEGDLTGVAEELADLAGKLDQSARPDARDGRALARWLRGRAISLLDEAISFEPGAEAGDVGALLEDASSTGADDQTGMRIARRIEQLEALSFLRRKLESDGADLADPAASERAFGLALERLEEDVAALLDAGFRRSMAAVLAEANGSEIDLIVTGLAGELAALDALAARISALFGRRSRLKERVVGPRIGSLVAALVGGLDGRDRDRLRAKIDALKTTLEKHDLGSAIVPEQWLEWSTLALVRSERVRPAPAGPPGYAAFRAMRAAEQRTPIAVTLRDIALRVAPPTTESAEQAEQALLALLLRVPDGLRAEAAESDLSRVERAVDHLERWWWGLTGGIDAKAPLDDARERLAELVASRFLNVVLDEASLLRFALEARVVAETFPSQSERAAAVRARIDELRRAVRLHVVALGKTAGDQAWGDVLAKKGR